ncbi:hypothetical protein ACIRQH_35085 [Streptomyces sp. NPDC102279]|uniref:hypothetical protein n=1 Tax=Streptomyces sp. NPDC102279 TaxID=3366153 RepID=UPI0038115198
MRRLSSETWFLVGFAAVIWLLALAATVSMALGNSTAINAVVGCSIPGAFLTWCAVSFARQDTRWRP